MDNRIIEHNTSNKLGAKYTKTRRPVHLVYQESAPSRSVAAKREWAIKKMTKWQKEALIRSYKRND